MAVLAHYCPHCRTAKVAHQVIGVRLLRDDLFNAFLHCPVCSEGSVAVVANRRQDGAPGFTGRVSQTHDCIEGSGLAAVMRFLPAFQPPSAPAHTPPEVARIFEQAEDAAQSRSYDLAAMGYRRTLETALKRYAPQHIGMLYPRIEALAASHDITPAMKDWAHEVRLIGNEAAHEEAGVSLEDVAAIALFTRTLLEYLFTLPGEVAARKQKVDIFA